MHFNPIIMLSLQGHPSFCAPFRNSVKFGTISVKIMSHYRCSIPSSPLFSIMGDAKYPYSMCTPLLQSHVQHDRVERLGTVVGKRMGAYAYARVLFNMAYGLKQVEYSVFGQIPNNKLYCFWLK